jgi:hypothetical protein
LARGFLFKISALFYILINLLKMELSPNNIITSFPNKIYAEADFLGGTALFPLSFNFYIAL